MRLVPILTVTCCATFSSMTAWGADSYSVIATPTGDRVVVQIGSLPVALSLAHIEVPEAQQAAAQEALQKLIAGKRVEIVYLADFGIDANGAARVQLISGKANVNEELVARGLAKYQLTKSGVAAESAIKRAQDKAQKAHVGLWQDVAAGDQAAGEKLPVVATIVAPGAKTPAGGKNGAPAVAKGPFCSELDNSFYYATGSREVANVSAQRLIFYADEATAQKAGKRKPVKAEAQKRGTTEADADAAYAMGKQIATEAVDAGNTSNRDELYEKAYVNLTQAMQIYSELVDQKPDDEKLSGKLQQCMQLRYGTVKMRRFAH